MQGREAPLITLLTDFGTADGYVGAMKGVISSRAPGVTIVDLAHDVPAQDVLAAGLIWRASVPYFPRGSVHAAVVDPGVGTDRAILVVETADALFLAPDNGLVGYAIDRRRVRRVVVVSNRAHFLPELSATFHGRDIVAPVAAALACGLALEELGAEMSAPLWGRLPRPRRRRSGGGVEVRGEVITIDHFGNAITNVRPEPGARFGGLQVGPHRIARLRRTYGAAGAGQPLVLTSSLGFLEVAVSGGNARAELKIRRGDPVVVRWRVKPG